MSNFNTKSIWLSRVATAAFMVVLGSMDVAGIWLVDWFLSITRYSFALGQQVRFLFLASLYLCSIPAWVVLVRLNRLLGNIQAGQVFVKANVSAMRQISWGCAAAGMICLLSGIYYIPFLFLAAAAAFMALIVQVVKNCFAAATEMKDELDYTV